MKPDKKISVLLPVFNAEKYISEAVDSILNQTFRDFEFIIINDGSTDKTLDILKGYESRDNRIRLISRENKGLITSLNEGIDLAKGEWIARMDADDISLPNRLERQLYWIGQTGADILGSWVAFFGAKGLRIWEGCVTDEAIKVDMLFKCPLVHPSVMMCTSLAKKLLYNSASKDVEDYDLWVRASIQGSKIFNIPEVLLRYRQHDSQVTVTAQQKQLKATEEIRKEYWKHFLSLHQINSADRYANNGFAVTVLESQPPNLGHAIIFYSQLADRLGLEERKTILDNVYRLSLRNPNLGQLWVSLNNKYGVKKEFFKSLSLALLKVVPASFWYRIYSPLKRAYFFVMKK